MRKELFPHQLEMVEATKKYKKGILLAPTGAGKTLAQAGIVSEFLKKNKFGVITVKSPRIGLSNQLSEEYINYFDQFGFTYKSILIHSGDSPLDIEPDEELDFEERIEYFERIKNIPNSTSSTNELVSQIARARELDIPYIIFTTYHSNQKVYDALEGMGIKIKLDINDEAHYLVREDFSNLLSKKRAKKQYFFTATLKETSSNRGKGMNNGKRFGNGGEPIYEMTIKYAVDNNLIIPIKPTHIYSSLDGVDSQFVEKEVGQMILESFNYVESEIKGLATKILVAAKNSKQIKWFTNSKQYTELRNRDVNVLTVHSTKEYTTYNGEVISRKEFDILKSKLGSDINKKLIIIHQDILSEGIDVPGLLGVLILRKMGEAKFLQTIGRAVRVYRPNPELKPYGVVMMPYIDDVDMIIDFREHLINIQKEGYIPSEMVVEYLMKGDGEPKEFERSKKKQRKLDEIDLELYSQQVDLGEMVDFD